MTATGHAGEPAAQQPPATPQETLSQLIARILDQLSVSAWLPAAALVFIFVLVGSLRHEDGDLSAAIGAIGAFDLGDIVLLVSAVVVTTMLTQAFQFEAIRLLEGYWGTWRPIVWLAEWRCRHQLDRRDRLLARANHAEERAVEAAQKEMLSDGIPPALVGTFLAIKLGGDFTTVSKPDLEAAAELEWTSLAPAHELRLMDALISAAAEYPESDRLVLPTKLGNTLRAREEPLHDRSDGKLENLVHRIFDDVPVALQVEHDQFRSRLDLYCSLVLVFAVGGGIATILLAGYGTALVVTAAALTVVLSTLSYRAAIASARAYGDLLVTMTEVSETNEEKDLPAPS